MNEDRQAKWYDNHPYYDTSLPFRWNIDLILAEHKRRILEEIELAERGKL